MTKQKDSWSLLVQINSGYDLTQGYSEYSYVEQSWVLAAAPSQLKRELWDQEIDITHMVFAAMKYMKENPFELVQVVIKRGEYYENNFSNLDKYTTKLIKNS